MYRNYRIMINTLANGDVNVPEFVKISYRYKDTYSDPAYVNVYGFKHGSTTPIIMAYGLELPDSTCGLERHMSHLIRLKKETGILDFFVQINNRESIRDLHNIIGVHEIQGMPAGELADEGDFTCGLRLMTFEINNGDVFTYSNIVFLSYTNTGTATHWQVSESPNFYGASWVSVLTSPTYTIQRIGPTTLYFRLKNADEVSNILNASIGRHGAPWLFPMDDVILNVLSSLTESVTVSLSTPTPLPVSESVSISEYEITELYADDIP